MINSKISTKVTGHRQTQLNPSKMYLFKLCTTRSKIISGSGRIAWRKTVHRIMFCTAYSHRNRRQFTICGGKQPRFRYPWKSQNWETTTSSWDFKKNCIIPILSTYKFHSGWTSSEVHMAGGCSCTTFTGWKPASNSILVLFTVNESWPFHV